MGCSPSCIKKTTGGEVAEATKAGVDVGSPRKRSEISDKTLWQTREQESELSSCCSDLPPELVKKLSKQSSKLSDKYHDKLGHFQSRGPGFSMALSMASVDSQLDYAAASQTIIIFDWDDTLCPSSSLRPYFNFDRYGRLTTRPPREIRRELKMLSDVVVPLLQLAKTMGHVIIVTNARAPWVDVAARNFLPLCQEVLADIPVTYALELVDQDSMRNYMNGAGCLLTETKARAMKAAVSQFYSRYPGQSWKNIVSIGDADFEHDAIRQVVSNQAQEKTCRTKTIKMLDGPTIAGVVVQLTLLKGWLHQIVQTDADIGIDMMDDRKVNECVATYGDPQDLKTEV